MKTGMGYDGGVGSSPLKQLEGAGEDRDVVRWRSGEQSSAYTSLPDSQVQQGLVAKMMTR